ncbi:MAG: protein kinase, partial [Myxococcota bacterium]
MHDLAETIAPEPADPPGSSPDAPRAHSSVGLVDGLLVGRYRLGERIGRGGSGEVFAAHDQLTDDRGPGWATWRTRVIGLLDVVARIHLAGVVHRDLKPANVLVERPGAPDERVVLVDFGLAQGRLVEPPTGGLVEGTPRYMAPEQRAARPSDERTDLFAVGAMVFELVTGAAIGRPPELGALARAPIPPVVVGLVGSMLAEDPADRPRSALDVLAALDADPRDGIGARMPPGPWTRRQLRGLIVDRERSFLHLAEDAAALLFAEAGGDERATRRTLDRWIRAGLATWSTDGRVAITRSAIEQLAASRPESPQAELVAMLEAGAEPDAVSAAARRIGSKMARAGQLERALAVLDAAELWARGTPAERGLLEDRVAWSLGLETPAAAERALYRVQRAELDPDTRRAWGTLLRGGRAALGGEPDRALEILSGTPDGLAEALEVYWYGVRFKAATLLGLAALEPEVESLAGWAAATPVRTSKWTGWRGYLRYLQRRYDEAAALLLEAARTRRIPRERAQMWY